MGEVTGHCFSQMAPRNPRPDSDSYCHGRHSRRVGVNRLIMLHCSQLWGTSEALPSVGQSSSWFGAPTGHEPIRGAQPHPESVTPCAAGRTNFRFLANHLCLSRHPPDGAIFPESIPW